VDSEPGEHGQHMELAREALKKAILSNPADARAHYLLAEILLSFDHDWPGALAEIQIAKRIDPNLTEPQELVIALGCKDGSCYHKFIRDISRDIERDPLNAFAFELRGEVYFSLGKLEAAEHDLRQVVALSPGSLPGAADLSLVLMARNKLDEAARVLASMPDSLKRRWALAILYIYQGKRAQADATLADMLAKDSRGGSFEIAMVYAAMGNASAAIDWLEHDYDNRMWGMMAVNGYPLFRSLAHEPRYIALMQKFAPSGGF
jgi:tetratricopeptide (TPR) repeat protein